MLQKLLLFKETDEATVPTNPTCYTLQVENFGVKASQKSEVNTLIGSGRGAARKTYGNFDIGGNIDFIWSTENAPILLHHGIGKATAVTDATTTSWAAATAYAVGDMENHSDGTHTLVCKTAGTSGSIEPSLSGVSNGATVADGGVVWYVQKRLKKYVGERADCLDTFGVEATDGYTCTGGTDSYTRFLGLRINSLPLSLNGGAMSLKSSVDTVGMKKEDSIIDSSFTNLLALSGASEVALDNDSYSIDQCTVYINGVAAAQTTDFAMTTSNNASVQDGLNREKISDLGQVENSGSIKCLFDTDKYKRASEHTVQSAKIEFKKENGCKITINYPTFEMDAVDKVFETNKSTMLDIPIYAFDTEANKSVTYEVISPLSSY